MTKETELTSHVVFCKVDVDDASVSELYNCVRLPVYTACPQSNQNLILSDQNFQSKAA